MSELKAVHAFDVYEAYTKTGDDDAAQVYLKSEADKAIADLEESHKMEVEQLLMEITELKKKRDTAEKLLNKALYCVSNSKNHMMSLARKKNHADYKRCLALAGLAEEASCYHATLANGFWLLRNDLKKRDDERRIAKRWDKWQNRWLAIAENFKPNPTINRKGGTNALQR